MEVEASIVDVLMKVVVFVVIQLLVYIILSNSSSVFSKNKMRSSFSFKPARSLSIRRALAAISDIPFGSDSSPSPRGLGSSTEDCPLFDEYVS